MRKQSISRPALRYIVAIAGGAAWLAVVAPDRIKSSPVVPDQAAIIIYQDSQNCAECHTPEDLNILCRNHNRPAAQMGRDCSQCHRTARPDRKSAPPKGTPMVKDADFRQGGWLDAQRERTNGGM